jgi:hypothetical protein
MAEAQPGPGIVFTFAFQNSTKQCNGRNRDANRSENCITARYPWHRHGLRPKLRYPAHHRRRAGKSHPRHLFQDPNLIAAGADIAQSGKCSLDGNYHPLKPRPLADCYDLNHYHEGWKDMYHSGLMDGACTVPVTSKNCVPPPFPQYVYVDNTGSTPIQPYWEIAEKYGFANYFFQTNQGPSFPAHQFLIAGYMTPLVLPRNSETNALMTTSAANRSGW